MLKLVWRETALDDLDEILDYIAERDPAAADRLHAEIDKCAGTLPLLPRKHRLGRVAGTREAVVHPNYLMVYRVTAEEVEVLSVMHARRRYP
ncbi:MAG TPA: type II toxin-antitoxin system RelE/ParE family toxin [Allosphingosinicella sp.]